MTRLISTDLSGNRGLLDRRDLLQLLDRAVTKRVTVIAAPPGSGKTSLLRAWASRSTKTRDLVFVTVARDQQSDLAFWSAVLDAVRGSVLSIESRPSSAPTAGLDVDQVIAGLLAEMADRREPVVLIIDDLHELKSAPAINQLEYLLANVPRGARVVLSSRRDPSIRLHQLRLADEVADIRAGDLRFSELETRELLARSSISLSDAGAAGLHRRTEGWAGGLRLAVISLRDHPDPERFVTDFSGTDRAVGEYLMAEMLERQPSGVQRMLLRTSLVDRVSGELADKLVDRSGSEQMLLELEDANAFVVSLDPGRTWFRYHQLLADFLRLELRRTSAEVIPDLHRRAGSWFADRGDVVDAVRHMIAAGDWPEAARLVADHSFTWVLDADASTIRTVLGWFPEGAAANHPDLALAHAAAELNRGRVAAASAQLTLAESHIRSRTAIDPRLDVATAALRLAIARRSGQFDDVIEHVQLLDASIGEASSEPAGIDRELRAVALLNLGIVETWSGRFADAERHLADGATLAHALGRPYIEVGCRAFQAFPSPTVSFATALERGRHAFALAEHHGLSDRPVLAPAYGAVACMIAWTGEFDEAEHWLRRGWDGVQADADPAAEVLLYMVTGMLHIGRSDHDAALEALTAAVHAQLLLTGVHILSSVITDWLVATQARRGMLDAARATLAALSSDDAQLDGIVLARALTSLADGDAATALSVLGDVRDFMPPPGFPAYGLVEANVLAGRAHLALGDRSAAAAATEAALAAAEPDRLVFPFVLHGAAELLEIVPRHETAHGALLADVVDLLRGARALNADKDALPQFGELSPSEFRVLRFLPTNLTRPEIAHELGVSINTVNTHIRNVYAKLGASDRSMAVQRARQLRLLAHRSSSASRD